MNERHLNLFSLKTGCTGRRKTCASPTRLMSAREARDHRVCWGRVDVYAIRQFLLIGVIASAQIACLHRSSAKSEPTSERESMEFGYLSRRCEVERGSWSFSIGPGQLVCGDGRASSAWESVDRAAAEFGRRGYDCEAGSIENAEWQLDGWLFRCRDGSVIQLQLDGGALLQADGGIDPQSIGVDTRMAVDHAAQHP
jgi:hypothetical protein